ncbi:hypothetical protein V3C99_015367 [Haemonchus contortus]
MEVVDTGSPSCKSELSPNAVEEMYRYLGESLSVDQTQPPSALPSCTGLSPSARSTQTPQSTQYSCSPGFGLSFKDLDIIREHLLANGKLNESKKMSLAWLMDNISILPSLVPRSGGYLEHLIGKEHIYVKDALMALDLLAAHGIITAVELATSEDAQVLSQAHPLDRLTFHSLANVVRNIFKERPE